MAGDLLLTFWTLPSGETLFQASEKGTECFFQEQVCGILRTLGFMRR